MSDIIEIKNITKVNIGKASHLFKNILSNLSDRDLVTCVFVNVSFFTT